MASMTWIFLSRMSPSSRARSSRKGSRSFSVITAAPAGAAHAVDSARKQTTIVRDILIELLRKGIEVLKKPRIGFPDRFGPRHRNPGDR